MTDRSAQNAPPQVMRRSLSDTEPFLRGILGSTVLLLIALAIEHLFFSRGYYSSLVLHPFWIIVLLATLESGLYVGVATAALAALMMDWPPRPVGVDITAYFIDLAILPLQWLVAAVCIGLFRQADIGRMAALQRETARLQEMAEALADEVLRTDAALHDVELRVLTQRLDGGVPPAAMRHLADLAHAPLDRLAEAFEAAAGLTPLPAALILAAPGGGFDVVAGAEGVGLSSPLTADEPLLTAARAADRAHVLSQDPLPLVIAGVSVGGVLAGAVVLAAPGPEVAEAACPLADLLAGGVLLSLRALATPMAEAAE